jgi:zinc protease
MTTGSIRKKLLASSLAAALLASASAAGQTAAVGGGPQQNPADEGLKGVVLKGRAPVNRELLKVRLPRAQEATLKNGLRVVVLESRRTPTVSMQLVVMSGGLSDPADHRGLAQYTAALLREGTQKRASRDIAEQLDRIGAQLSAGSSLSGFTSSVTASGLSENFDQILDVFADVVRNPAFPAAEVEKYKTRMLSQLQFQRSIAGFLAAESFNRAVYGEHPASLVAPSPESLKRTDSETLAKFHAEHYLPNNSLLAVVGDVKLAELMPKLERAFGDWKQASAPKTLIPAAAAAYTKPRLILIDRPGSVQTLLQLGNISLERTDPDHFALQVMNRILGGGGTARLQRNLREEKGYTYGAGSSFNSLKYRGTWQATSSVRTEVTGDAMREFFNEFTAIRDRKVSAFDLENAKRALVGSFALDLERPQLLLSNIVTQKIYELPADYWDAYPQRIAAVTAEDVQRVARKYVDLDRLQIVAVGDAAKVREALARYGTVEVFDANGRPVTQPAETKAND